MKRLIIAATAALLLGACAGAATPTAVTTLFVPHADVTAMAFDQGDGAFYYATRGAGDVFKRGSAVPVAHVDVSSDGQRGLLGLAIDSQHRLFAGFTAASTNKPITIAQVFPGPTRVVWNGPASADLANGTHIAFGPDGRLVIGIGDLTDRSKLTDAGAPNGKFFSFDSDGAANQKPKLLSSSWNNPFAFGFAPSGKLWVGDNEPGNDSERLAQADLAGASHVAHIGSHKVASGLAFTPDGSLWECTYVSHSLQKFKIDASGNAKKSGPPVVTDCSLGVVTTANGALVYSTGTELRQVHPN